jgi:CheY-like chemotaxis protein
MAIAIEKIATQEIRGHQRQALVVDDSQIARYILSNQLERLGFAVEVAESAESALRQLRDPPPDVVFMDHLLPGIDGLEAVRRLRALPQCARLRIVMYTSQDSDEFMHSARGAGADEIYLKTANQARLSEILDRLELLPESSGTAETAPNIVSITGSKQRAGEAIAPEPSLTRDGLARLLEPSLEAHHSRLRHELLGEFTILERYEERRRRDLLSRLETVGKRTEASVESVLLFDRIEQKKIARRRGVASWALAAALTAGVVLSAIVSSKLLERTEALERATEQITVTIDENTEAFALLRRQIDQTTTTSTDDTSQASNPVPGGEPFQPPADMYSANAAAFLVAELQKMGILGPVSVDTTAGRFCVMQTVRGLDFVGPNAPPFECGGDSMQLTAANFR